MPRMVNEQEYAARRNEILDAAQRFIYTKGYGQMTIQDILGTLHISKGAFYHYFDSKQAVMEALTERMFVEVQAFIAPLLADATLPALEKFRRFFESLSRWKMEQKSFVLGLLNTWYADDNALLRYKVQANMFERVALMLSEIIAQGVREGVMDVSNPQQAGQVVFTLILGMNEGLAGMLLAPNARSNGDRMIRSVAAYTSAIERVLSVPPGSICLIDANTMQEWIEILGGQGVSPVQDYPPWAPAPDASAEPGRA